MVEMTLTTPGCPASESLPEMARVAIADAVGAPVAVEVRGPCGPALESSNDERRRSGCVGIPRSVNTPW